MNDLPKSTSVNSEDQELNIKQLLEQYAYYWKWFIISVFVFIIGALIYLRYADKIFNITAKILLQDENKATGELAGLSELANLAGGNPASAFVLDQIDVMKSRRIFSKVVEQNRLNIGYFNKGNVKSSELLEVQSPIRLVLLQSNKINLDSIKYSISIRKDGKSYII